MSLAINHWVDKYSYLLCLGLASCFKLFNLTFFIFKESTLQDRTVVVISAWLS